MSFEKASAAIRLIGGDHTSHHEGTILGVADELTVRNNRNVVTQAHAQRLVAEGRAEWVGEPPPDPAQGSSGQVAHSEAAGDAGKGPWSDGTEGEFD